MKNIIKFFILVSSMNLTLTYANGICPDVANIKKDWSQADVINIEKYPNSAVVVVQAAKAYGTKNTWEARAILKDADITTAKSKTEKALNSIQFVYGNPTPIGAYLCRYITSDISVPDVYLVSKISKPLQNF